MTTHDMIYTQTDPLWKFMVCLERIHIIVPADQVQFFLALAAGDYKHSANFPDDDGFQTLKAGENHYTLVLFP